MFSPGAGTMATIAPASLLCRRKTTTSWQKSKKKGLCRILFGSYLGRFSDQVGRVCTDGDSVIPDKRFGEKIKFGVKRSVSLLEGWGGGDQAGGERLRSFPLIFSLTFNCVVRSLSKDIRGNKPTNAIQKVNTCSSTC